MELIELMSWWNTVSLLVDCDIKVSISMPKGSIFKGICLIDEGITESMFILVCASIIPKVAIVVGGSKSILFV